MSEPSTLRCYECGAVAENTCNGCEQAVYCSLQCQALDYATSHKELCQGPLLNLKIHSVLRELFTAEWKWLNGTREYLETDMERLYREKILGEKVEDDEHVSPLNHEFRSGEVALVLMGVSPCALIINYRYWTYGQEYYAVVLHPWFVRHQEFLVEQGLDVELINHEVYCLGHLCGCLDADGNTCGKLADIAQGGCALVKNTRSPKINLVNEIFTKERSEDPKEWDEEEQVSVKDLVECLSFPLGQDTAQLTPFAEVTYQFEFPNKIFGGHAKDYCCSPCFKIKHVIDPADALGLAEHYAKAVDAMDSIGFKLVMSVVGQGDWPDEALAKMWYVISGRDMQLMEELFRSNVVQFTIPVDTARNERILDIARELDLS